MHARLGGQKIGTDEQYQEMSRVQVRLTFPFPFRARWDLLIIPGVYPPIAFERAKVDIKNSTKGEIYQIIAIVDGKRWRRERGHRITLLNQADNVHPSWYSTIRLYTYTSTYYTTSLQR